MKMVKTKRDVFNALRGNSAHLHSLGVKRIGLFGSFVRDEQKALSDVDLLVEFFPGKKTFDNFMNLSFFLEDLLRRKVEVVTLEALSPYLGPHILNEVEYVTIAA